MARLGVDYSFDPPTVAELLAAGATFAVRYVSEPGHVKNLTLAEAERLSAAGLDVAVVFQRSKAFMLEGPEAGIADATSALTQARGCGMPAGRPIYFALDIDPNPLTSSQWTAVAQYLQGAALVIGLDRVGVYGGRKAIEDLVPLWAAWGWQTRSWSGGVWSERAHLQQYEHNKPLGSGLVDWNRALTADFGQWKVATMQLVSRADWGARAPRNRQPLDRNAQRGSAVHYTAADADEQADHANCAGRVRGIQSFHMDGNGWADIAYSFLACKHGTVFEGRGRGVRTAAQGTDAGNDAYHAVCFLGDDTSGRDDVTGAGREAIAAAVAHCNAWAGVDGVRPHSSFKATACPGDQLRAFIAAGMPTTTEEDDMTPEQAAQLAAIHAGLIVPGTTSPDQTIDKLFERVRSIEQGMVVPGTTSVAQAFELLFDRVRTIEATVTTPPEPLPEIEGEPFVIDSAAVAAALAGDTGFLAAVAKAVNDDAARRQAE